MRVEIETIADATNEIILVKVFKDEQLDLTLELPLTGEFLLFEEKFELKEDVEECLGWIPGLILPTGYVAVGVFRGGRLHRILLAGRGLSRILMNTMSVEDAITANEAEIAAEQENLLR
ncbi:hypothetical protein [Brucella thiophenivorans]|uniref:Uncharacterized protein n=1 Tax=Brucella thiophenivorans TaxID=571255 RepID=A0A256FJ48_9HYPH|nr:hypothetical protein [Brucella thiophenivorans]OYR14873.1 hypothetical protein CEV31_3187 [Brucella thiophenivorans]